MTEHPRRRASDRAEDVFAGVLPGFLSARLLVAVSVTGAILTLGVVLYGVSRVETQISETRALARCVTVMLANHRVDNRHSHDALASQHQDAFHRDTMLPEPPERLLVPREGMDQLEVACDRWLRATVERVPPPPP